MIDGSGTWSGQMENNQFETLRRELVAQVPTGRKIFITRVSTVSWWEQRIAEFAAMHGVTVVQDAGDADYAVSLGSTSVPGRGGVRLIVTPAG